MRFVAYKSNAYHYQADEAYRVISENRIESELMSPKDSIATLELLEAILASTKKVNKDENSHSRLWFCIRLLLTTENYQYRIENTHDKDQAAKKQRAARK